MSQQQQQEQQEIPKITGINNNNNNNNNNKNHKSTVYARRTASSNNLEPQSLSINHPSSSLSPKNNSSSSSSKATKTVVSPKLYSAVHNNNNNNLSTGGTPSKAKGATTETLSYLSAPVLTTTPPPPTTKIDSLLSKESDNNNNNNNYSSYKDDDAEIEYLVSRTKNILSNSNNNNKNNTSSTTNNIINMFFVKVRLLITRLFNYCCNKNNSIRLLVLVVLSLQNSLFTVLRRYSQGVLKENYSKYEVLLVGEYIKIVFSVYMIKQQVIASNNSASENDNNHSKENDNLMNTTENGNNNNNNNNNNSTKSSSNTNKKQVNAIFYERIVFVIVHSGKMFGLALIYGAMNILSFVSLRNIGAGMFTIFAQCKILTTATFSTILLNRKYSWTKWRSLAALMAGVLLFSEPIWGNSKNFFNTSDDNANVFIGILAVVTEVTLSGFASIYFEKVIKLDPLKLTIWERNFQLALGSFPVYICFIAYDRGGSVGLFGGWSMMALVVATLGAAGGILVALSIKYGDAILKTLATTAAIVLSSFLDWMFLNGPLTPTMCIAAFQVIIAIADYSFDATPEDNATTNVIATNTDGIIKERSGTQSKSNNNNSLFSRNHLDKDSERSGDDPEDQVALLEMRRQIK